MFDKISKQARRDSTQKENEPHDRRNARSNSRHSSPPGDPWRNRKPSRDKFFKDPEAHTQHQSLQAKRDAFSERLKQMRVY